ncbi:NUDIX domain-containing protein [Dactylosporangium sp. NPDC051485]|uniref:NUDIX hydrolase n=1 Tax=Dactylosporangium sp. NPDC051485 TaxID=3154846 RepID=UPI0034466FEC
MTVRHLTASAVVFDGAGRVLLVRHLGSGLWLYPGGHLEDGEEPAAAAVRETREETGLRVRAVAPASFTHPAVTSHPVPFTVIEMPVRDDRFGDHRHIDLVYVCEPVNGLSELVAQAGEVSEVSWVPVTKIADTPCPPELPALITAASHRADSLR